MAKKNTSNYQYTKLSQINVGFVNVIGVVKFLKLPTATRGTDFIQVFSITDDSLDTNDRVVITLFYKDKAKFPSLIVGDIIRFHRLKVENFNDEMRGKNGCGFTWLLVRHDADQPVASSSSFSYSESCKQQVRELLSWSEKQVWSHLSKLDSVCPMVGRGGSDTDSSVILPLLPTEAGQAGRAGEALVQLAAVVGRQYFDLECLVIGCAVEKPGSSVILRVWDGTRCTIPLVPSGQQQWEVDAELQRMVGDMAVDVYVFDNHTLSCKSIKPGSFIRLVNLHAWQYKEDMLGPEARDSPTYMLCLHRGCAFKRGLHHMDPLSPSVMALKHRLRQLGLGSGAGSPSASASVSSLPAHRSAERPGTSSMEITHMSAAVSEDRESSSSMGGGMVTGGGVVTEGCLVMGHVVDRGQAQDRDGCRQLTGVGGHADLSAGSDMGQHPAPTQLMEMPAPAMGYTISSASGAALPGLAIHTETGLAKDFVSGETLHLSGETLHSANGCFKVPFQLTANRASSGGSHSEDSQTVGALSSCSQPTGTRLEMGGNGSQPGETASQQDDMEPVFPSPMCMLQTATVVCGHPGSSYTSIKALRRQPVPGKFRLLAHLVAFHPDTLDPPGHVQCFCSQCTYLCSARGVDDETSSLEPGWDMEDRSMEHRDTESMVTGKWGGAFADWSRKQDIVGKSRWPGNCPRCVTAGQPVKLELIYMLRMILRDYHGDFLVANLWQHNAVKFFNDVSPQTAFEQGQLKEQVLRLKQMCLGIPLPPDAACMPRMLDCCLMSYTTPHGTAFHIFDTVLV